MPPGTINALVVTEKGMVLDDKLPQAGLPAEVFHVAKMSQVGVGCALTTGGAVFMWGMDCFGGRHGMIYYPPVMISQQVTQIALGHAHAVMLKNDGTVLTSGYNDGHRHFGCLGRSVEVNYELAPITDAAFVEHPTVYVTAGFHVTGVIDSENAIWVMGAGSNGVLGLDDTKDRYTPTRLAAFSVSAPMQLTMSQHTVAVCKDGAVFSWGDNENGQLGLGDFSHLRVPHKVSCPSANTATCSRIHTMILTKEGEVFTCGYNRYGVTGLRDHFFSIQSSSLPPSCETDLRRRPTAYRAYLV